MSNYFDHLLLLLYGPYVRAVYTARTYGCIFDTRTYGPYLRPVFNGTVLTPVFTARICTGVKKFKYVRVTCKIPEYVFINITSLLTLFSNQNILNSTNIRCCGIKKSTSRRDHCRPRLNCVRASRKTRNVIFSHTHFTNSGKGSCVPI